MKKKLQKLDITQKLTSLGIMDMILPFKEHPSTEKKSSTSMDATDLFYFFTADIIKKNITFTR